MAHLDVTKKGIYLGIWLEDIFTDELIKNIASFAKVQKGKRIKATLNNTGLKLTRGQFLQGKKTTFFHINSIKTVTRNPDYSGCVLFILSDPKLKYKIIALRCASEEDARAFTDVFEELRKKAKTTNIDLKKIDNGNWTLRERSAHNANRHLTEIFFERKQPNGDVGLGDRDGADHVTVQKGVYIKRTAVSNNNYAIPNDNHDDDDDDDDDYVIETEVSNYPATFPIPKITTTDYGKDYDITEVKGQVDPSENDTIQIRRKVGPTPEERYSAIYSNPIVHSKSTRRESPPSAPVVYTATSHHPVPSKPVVYRASRSTPRGYYFDPHAPHKRGPGSYVYRRPGPGSTTGSVTVKFDQMSIQSNTSKMSRNLRSSDVSLPTTIQRSIEDTYPRPIVIRRYGDARVVNTRPRPQTYHPGVIYEKQYFHVPDRDILL